MATDARRQPAAGEDLGEQPAERVADRPPACCVELADDVFEVVGDLPDRLLGEHLGVGVGLVDRVGVVGPAGRERSCSRPSSKTVRHRSQLLGSSHRPWTNTTGVLPDAFAWSTCSSSSFVTVRASS